jgi:serine/threonine-protein kinase
VTDGAPSRTDLAAVFGRTVPAGTAIVVDGYRVDRIIGKGGSAVVVAATHQRSGERAALKVLRADAAARRGAVERFVREACVAMRLRGDGVARVRDVCTTGHGLPYIVMDLLDGRDLGSVLRERGPLDVESAVDCILQTCEAIAEAHALGVVHRDLKPANLFLARNEDGDERVKVLDFGISKVHDDAAPAETFAVTAPSSEAMRAAEPASHARRAEPALEDRAPPVLTETHAVMGSPRYMAPEQHVSARDVDARCDVWALGVVLYELVVGKPPFEARTLGELRIAIHERHPPPVSDARVPAGLLLAIETCLAKESCDRFQSVEALAEAIAPFGSAAAPALLERVARAAHPAREIARRAPTLGLITATLRSVSGRRKLQELAAKHTPIHARLYVALTSAFVLLVAGALALTVSR